MLKKTRRDTEDPSVTADFVDLNLATPKLYCYREDLGMIGDIGSKSSKTLAQLQRRHQHDKI